MRGKGSTLKRSAFLTGITPAHAGKSIKMKKCIFFSEDHPRTCGEKYISGVAVVV